MLLGAATASFLPLRLRLPSSLSEGLQPAVGSKAELVPGAATGRSASHCRGWKPGAAPEAELMCFQETWSNELQGDAKHFSLPAVSVFLGSGRWKGAALRRVPLQL